MTRPQTQALRHTPKLFSSSSSTTPFPSSASWPSTSSILGGDYAGQSATFSSIDGKLIPVPEHYVPESMVEWGQVPSCLEVIVSEDLHSSISATGTGTNTNTNTSTSASSNPRVLERNTVTVMPEVGCGLDNLDTIKNKDEIPISSYHTFELDHVRVATTFVKEKKRHIECIFVHEMEMERNEEERQGGDGAHTKMRRTRVCVNLHENNQLKSPIDIIREHKTAEESSHGTIAEGGGLDARTVTQLVGRENISKPFCKEEACTVESLEGNWQEVVAGDCDGDGDDDGEKSIFQFDAEYWNSDDATTLNLPGGVQVRHCLSPRTVEVCLLEASYEDGLPVKRIVVKYILDGHGPEVKCYSVEKVD